MEAIASRLEDIASRLGPLGYYCSPKMGLLQRFLHSLSPVGVRVVWIIQLGLGLLQSDMPKRARTIAVANVRRKAGG